MGTNFELNMNDFLPLRDVVFNTLRQAILRGELQPGERLLNSSGKQAWCEPYTNS